MRISAAALTLGLSGSVLAQARHAGVVVGRDSTGRLHIHIDVELPVVLPLAHFPMLTGYAGPEPGWGSLVENEPHHNLYTLSPSSDIVFVLVAADAGMGVLNDPGTGLMNPGESFVFGPPPFNRHPVYNVYAGAGPHALRLIARDRAGIHPDSPESVLSFVPGCYANCDGGTQEPILSVNDFVCFMGMFASGEPNANCDGSTAPSPLNVNDFVCFMTRFAAGCP